MEPRKRSVLLIARSGTNLLLGLMRVEASYGAQMLRRKRLDPANLRLRIAELQPEATIHGAGGGDQGALESSEMLEAVMVQYGPYEYSDNEVLKLTESLELRTAPGSCSL
jgi:hypothetical protein